MHEVTQLSFMDLMLALARVGSALLMLPILGQSASTVLSRLLLAVPFAYFLVATGVVTGYNGNWLILITKEVAIGMLLGFIWALPFYAIETVGHLIDFQTGLTFTQTVDPFLGEQAGISATMFTRAFATIFVVAGGFAMMLDVLFTSYRIWPALATWPQFGAVTLGVLVFEQASLFTLALLFAAPVMVVLLLVEFAAGIVSKAAQGMDLQGFLLAAKTWLGWLLIMLSLPYVLGRLVELLPSLAALSLRALSQ
jgi:type III secretion protein T